jgi:hypothetical protein
MTYMRRPDDAGRWRAAAMIENAGKMAGMPVGPLSLGDESGDRPCLEDRIGRHRKDLGVKYVEGPLDNILEEMVVKRMALWPQERQGLLRLPRPEKSLWPGIPDVVGNRNRPTASTSRNSSSAAGHAGAGVCPDL